jgi:hypothetical protein
VWRLSNHGWCFRKLLTVLHTLLKTLFVIKSTKTIFAVSSIRFIKPLNSSSSSSLEQVYFIKKTNKQKHQNIFIKCYNEKIEKKENFNFLGMHIDHIDLSKCMTRFLHWCSFYVQNDWLLALSLSLSQINLKNKSLHFYW